MLRISFTGVARFLMSFGDTMDPDNIDASPSSQAMAGAQLPPFPVQGIHWTRHERPRRPPRAQASRAHLRVVK